MSETDSGREHIAKWLRLHLTGEVGAKTFAKLVEYMGGIDKALGASVGQLMAVPGIGSKKAEKIAVSRDEVDVEAELERADRLGVEIVTLESASYPQLLKQIIDPPPVLYVKGELRREDALAVALVGSRNCSHYGEEQASRLSHLLAAAGFSVVSGLARGIDTAAHRGALAADGRTIAVQGCGLAQVYPPENVDLAERIAKHGALVSELPLTFEPMSMTFPQRNRIISGLSLGTIVVEARLRSGALITARQAMEQNREVMAVPGRIDAPGSYGPHLLIDDGAKLIARIEDVLDALGHIGKTMVGHAITEVDKATQEVEPSLFDTGKIPLTAGEEAIMKCLDHDTVHIEEIITRTDLGAAQANASVTSLQLKGLLKQLPGSYYKKR